MMYKKGIFIALIVLFTCVCVVYANSSYLFKSRFIQCNSGTTKNIGPYESKYSYAKTVTTILAYDHDIPTKGATVKVVRCENSACTKYTTGKKEHFLYNSEGSVIYSILGNIGKGKWKTSYKSESHEASWEGYSSLISASNNS